MPLVLPVTLLLLLLLLLLLHLPPIMRSNSLTMESSPSPPPPPLPARKKLSWPSKLKEPNEHMPIDGRLPVELLRLCRGGGKADDEFVGVVMAGKCAGMCELRNHCAPFLLCFSRKRADSTVVVGVGHSALPLDENRQRHVDVVPLHRDSFLRHLFWEKNPIDKSGRIEI